MKTYITYEHDLVYPEDSIPITLFWYNAEEAKAYAKKVMEEDSNLCVTVYEATEI